MSLNYWRNLIIFIMVWIQRILNTNNFKWYYVSYKFTKNRRELKLCSLKWYNILNKNKEEPSQQDKLWKKGKKVSLKYIIFYRLQIFFNHQEVTKIKDLSVKSFSVVCRMELRFAKSLSIHNVFPAGNQNIW